MNPLEKLSETTILHTTAAVLAIGRLFEVHGTRFLQTDYPYTGTYVADLGKSAMQRIASFRQYDQCSLEYTPHIVVDRDTVIPKEVNAYMYDHDSGTEGPVWAATLKLGQAGYAEDVAENADIAAAYARSPESLLLHAVEDNIVRQETEAILAALNISVEADPEEVIDPLAGTQILTVKQVNDIKRIAAFAILS